MEEDQAQEAKWGELELELEERIALVID